MLPRQTLTFEQIDLADIAFWGLPLDEREGAFQMVRARPGFPHYDEPDLSGIGIPKGGGYYAVTRHADILEISRQPDIFSSAAGATSVTDMPEFMLDFFGSMINLDDPRHARMRKIVSGAFTPRMLKKLEDDVQRAATVVVDDLLLAGGGDFVTEVAARLPLKVICDMMGIPPSEYDTVFSCSNIILGSADPEYVNSSDDAQTVINALLTAGGDLHGLVTELGRKRRSDPTDDLTSALVTADVDGEQLTDAELGSFFILLVVAGNETTRNAIAHGLDLLTTHPDQRAIWAADYEGVATTAVEEIVRVASPVVWMRRTTTQDVTVSDHDLRAGDKVILYYWSANRDAAVFDDPYRFDVRRAPNPHVGFGGPGPHYCLGAHLARREISVMFRELFERVPALAVTGEPERLRSSFINGIKHLPCSVDGR